MKHWRLGIDIGGTFTDILFFDESSLQLLIGKVLTTSQDPSEGVIRGFRRLMMDHGLEPDEISHAVHATTLVSNAIIEKKGARTALITTEGFRDTLLIGREKRYAMYDLFPELLTPLVPRRHIWEAKERVSAKGENLKALDKDHFRQICKELILQKIESVAVVFLFSFLDPTNEVTARNILREEIPHLSVSISSEVAPEIREFERTSTAVANAYVKPLVDKYLSRLEEGLSPVEIYMMLSHGGIADLSTAREFPVKMVESGPTAGALVSRFFGELSGEDTLVAFDMGGTTAKVCTITKGSIASTYSFEVARVSRFKKGSGLPLKIPGVELIEIGAGGGSVAHLDTMGLLKVGPESASAEPGPACYGLGGDRPTVTDANLLLGYLNPSYFLGGEMALDAKAAIKAMEEKIGGPLNIDNLQAAWGIHNIVNENMALAMRIHMAEHGYDPRTYTLVATGGCGPMHSAHIAEKIGIKKIICPYGAGVASAIGLLVAPMKVDYVLSAPGKLKDLDLERITQIYSEMISKSKFILSRVGIQEGEISLIRMADMRYQGQGHEIVVPLPDEGSFSAESIPGIEQSFEDTYRKLYGRTIANVPVEVVSFRLFAMGPTPRVAFQGGQDARACDGQAVKGSRPAYFPDAGGLVETQVLDRYSLYPGYTGKGPAIIEERESTAIVPPGWRFTLDKNASLIIEVEK